MAQPELVPIRLETENWEYHTWAEPTEVLERWEVLAAKERLLRRLDERLNQLYGTC
jgi:hypothetical protein